MKATDLLNYKPSVNMSAECTEMPLCFHCTIIGNGNMTG